MADNNDPTPPPAAAAPEPSATDSANFSALLDAPVYELIEKGADRHGFETRDIKPGENK